MYKTQQRLGLTGLTEEEARHAGLTVMTPCEAALPYLHDSLQSGKGPDYEFAQAHLAICSHCRDHFDELENMMIEMIQHVALDLKKNDPDEIIQ